MKSGFRIVVCMALAALLAGCDSGIIPKEQRAGAVKVYRSSAYDPQDWKHVATIHGWADSRSVCHEIVELLNAQEPGQYICQELD